MLKHLCYFIIGFVLAGKLYAQEDYPGKEALLTRLEQYTKTNRGNILYLHTDKTIYTNNETIWFSAYLLKSLVNVNEHKLLSVVLMREDSREILIQNKYMLYQGWSNGSMGLPDTIAPGNYQLIAYTNMSDKDAVPVALFTKPLTIKSIREKSFNATLILLDTTINANGEVRAKVTVDLPYADPKEKRPVVTLQYSVGKGASQSVNLKNNTYTITIPARRLSQPDPVLLTSIKYDGEVEHLSVKLPEHRSDYIQVRFFPEGGSLVNGLESRVAWEARTSYDQPITVNAILYRNNIPVDTLFTDKKGIGVFFITPERHSSYRLRLTANAYLQRDTFYTLPPALDKGIVLHLPSAVVNDTLPLSISSTEARRVQVFIYYREDFAPFAMQLKPGVNKITVALPGVPKGIATITVLDEALRPLAERLFFTRYDQQVQATVSMDKTVYGKKEKVNVHLELHDQAGQAVQGLVSMAVVQDNRIEADKWQDIDSYLYIEHDLGRLPQDPVNAGGFHNRQYMEEVLLVKGWRKYTWQNMTAATIDSAGNTPLPPISIQVKRKDKLLKDSIMVGVIRDSLLDVVTTNTTGLLQLEPEYLLVKEGRRVGFALVNIKDPDHYEMEVHDPYLEINQQLAAGIAIDTRGFVQAIQNSEDWRLKGVEKAVVLQTVVVSTKKDNSIFGATANECGDYVCMYNILNCPNHFNMPSNKAPVKGQQYNRPGGGTIVYEGCVGVNPKTPFIKGIYAAREFYGLDQDSLAMREPQYLSTLYWEPGILVDSTGRADVSFYTGDITGRFRIVVQGVSERDALAGRYVFLVE